MPRRSPNGFTLIEVMVAMVLTGILVVGVHELLTTVGQEFYGLTLRQKAVFLLNGEMERLYAIHQYNKLSTDLYSGYQLDYQNTPPTAPSINVISGSALYANTLPAHAAINHHVYNLIPRGNPSGPCSVTERLNLTTLTCENITTTNFGEAGSERGILYYAGYASPVNVVWLDQEKAITARLSWLAEPVSTNCYQDGLVPGSCYLITLYLDYPFRYQAANPLDPGMGQIQTEILRTVVGDRY